MKKNIFGFLFIILGMVLTSSAGVFYVRATGTNGTGTSWASPWVGFSNIQWASVTAGSTICVAGGTYSNLSPGSSGAPGLQTIIKRATTADSVCGVNIPAGADSLISLSGISFNGPAGSSVTIDGQTEYGMKISFGSGGRGITFRGTVNNAQLKYIEIAGPAQDTSYNPTAEARGLEIDGTGRANNLLLHHMSIHGMDNLIWWQYSNYATIEYCKLYNSVSSSDGRFHGNVLFNSNSSYGTFRYNEVYNVSAEGIYFPYGGDTGWRIYGNIFRDAYGTGRAIETRQKESGVTGNHGTFYVYNNVFANGMYPGFRADAVIAGGEAYNNIMWKTSAQWNNLTTGNNWTGSTTSPFVSATDFRLKAASNAAPISVAGKALTSPAGQTLHIDPLGAVRGSDGTWDIGAYEFGGTVTPPSNPHPADTNSDYLMALNESTKYGACWKNPAAFGDCPAGIAIDYAVRAGTLWAGSATGQYQYNSANACPLCWEIKP